MISIIQVLLYNHNPDGSITGPNTGRSTSTGKFDENGEEIYKRDSGGYYIVDENGIQQPKQSPNDHGNTLNNQPTEIYEKYDAEGNYLKTGISQNADTRYSEEQLDGGYVEVIDNQSRRDAAVIERDRVERNPGPENKEPWAGKHDPSHPNYDPDYVSPNNSL